MKIEGFESASEVGLVKKGTYGYGILSTRP